MNLHAHVHTRDRFYVLRPKFWLCHKFTIKVSESDRCCDVCLKATNKTTAYYYMHKKKKNPTNVIGETKPKHVKRSEQNILISSN